MQAERGLCIPVFRVSCRFLSRSLAENLFVDFRSKFCTGDTLRVACRNALSSTLICYQGFEHWVPRVLQTFWNKSGAIIGGRQLLLFSAKRWVWKFADNKKYVTAQPQHCPILPTPESRDESPHRSVSLK